MNKLTTEEFIKRSQKIHGKLYEYSKVDYVDYNTKVCIFCPVHNHEFFITPYHHYKTEQGCPLIGYKRTSNKMTKTKGQFIEDAIKIHKNKYDYSKVVYIGNKTKVKIFCNKCKEYFFQKPSDHLFGCGCQKCGQKLVINKLKLTTKEFINKAIKIHGEKYDYSKVDYINVPTKVCIICPTHGDFWQAPGCHLYQKQKCPKCSIINGSLKHPGGYNEKLFNRKPELKNKPATLYFIKFKDECKIGITVNSIKQRFYGWGLKYEILKEKTMSLFKAWEKEQEILKLYKNNKCDSLIIKAGHTECFKYSPKLALNIMETMNA